VSAPSPSELEQALACLEKQADAELLGALCYDVVGACADLRTLQLPAGQVIERAAKLGASFENAVSELGNPLIMLERGLRAGAEFGLVSAFAARGFASALAALPESERANAADALVARLDWLELATDYRLASCLLRVLDDAQRDTFLDALNRAVQRDDTEISAPDATVRARNAYRLSMLSGVTNGAASLAVRSELSKRALRALRNKARDPVTRALCAVLLGELARDEGIAHAALRIAGVSRTPSRSLPVALLRWFSGFALLQALERLACYLIVLRRELEIELRGETLCVRGRTSLLGRTLRSSEACYEIWRVTGAFRRARFALLRSVVGVLSLSLGILVGGYLVFDGARGGAPLLLLIGAGLVAAGSSVDLLLNVLLPARAARVDVQVDLRDAASLRLGRVEQADADRLLEALSLKLSR
jgi:hypothetical protein